MVARTSLSLAVEITFSFLHGDQAGVLCASSGPLIDSAISLAIRRIVPHGLEKQSDNRFPFGIQSGTAWTLKADHVFAGVRFLQLRALIPLLSERMLLTIDQWIKCVQLWNSLYGALHYLRAENRPDRREVQELRKLAPGHLANESTNELAYGVIQEALKQHRAKAAGKAVGVEGKVSR
jgi:hypothetical protein